MGRGGKLILGGLLAGGFMLLGGCVNEHVNGTTIEYYYATWTPLLILVLGIGAIVGGWKLGTDNMYYAALLILGGITALVLLPGYVGQKAKISPSGFTVTTGFWMTPERHDVSFDDLTQVYLTSEESRGRRGRKTTTYSLTCSFRNGSSKTIAVGDIMKNGLLDRIFVECHRREIPVVDRT